MKPPFLMVYTTFQAVLFWCVLAGQNVASHTFQLNKPQDRAA